MCTPILRRAAVMKKARPGRGRNIYPLDVNHRSTGGDRCLQRLFFKKQLFDVKAYL